MMGIDMEEFRMAGANHIRDLAAFKTILFLPPSVHTVAEFIDKEARF